jgi:predicted Zn-dependent protease
MSRRFGQLTSLLILLILARSTLANKPLDTALASFQNGQYETALEHFRKLHAESPQDPDLTFFLARSLYRKLELKTAEELLNDSLKRHPGHVESHYLLGSVQLSLVAEVNIFRKAGLAKMAVKSWEQAVTLDPQHAEALYGVASFYSSAPGIAGGDPELGEQRIVALQKLSPAWADLTRASIAARAEEFAESEKLFKTAIDGIPGRAFPTLMLANLYLKQEQYESALKMLDQYCKRDKTWNDPGEEQTALLAGKIYQGLDKTEAAIASFEIVKRGVANRAMREQAEDALEKLYSR